MGGPGGARRLRRGRLERAARRRVRAPRPVRRRARGACRRRDRRRGPLRVALRGGRAVPPRAEGRGAAAGACHRRPCRRDRLAMVIRAARGARPRRRHDRAAGVGARRDAVLDGPRDHPGGRCGRPVGQARLAVADRRRDRDLAGRGPRDDRGRRRPAEAVRGPRGRARGCHGVLGRLPGRDRAAAHVARQPPVGRRRRLHLGGRRGIRVRNRRGALRGRRARARVRRARRHLSRAHGPRLAARSRDARPAVGVLGLGPDGGRNRRGHAPARRRADRGARPERRAPGRAGPASAGAAAPAVRRGAHRGGGRVRARGRAAGEPARVPGRSASPETAW